MSNLVMSEDKGSIEDVVFCYIKLQEGDTKYQSSEKEYSLDAVVDKATAKSFKKAFPKNGYKEIDTAEFKDKFKIEPPYPDAEEQFVIKFRVDVGLKSDVESQNLRKGDPVPYAWGTRPKLFVPVEGGVEDQTMSVLAANGSKGTVAFNITSNTFGTFPKMTGIMVTDLIAYEQSGGSASPFGDIVGGYKEGNGDTQQKASEAPLTSSNPTPVPSPSEQVKTGTADVQTPSEAATGLVNGFDPDVPF